MASSIEKATRLTLRSKDSEHCNVSSRKFAQATHRRYIP